MKHMFVVAHLDDEVLGAGALIYESILSGDEVCVIILNADFEKTRREMFRDIEKSHEILGITDRVLLSYKNMHFHQESHREIVESIEAEILRFQPDYIYTHSDKDLHNDHRITSICTQQAARLPQRHNAGHPIKALLFFEVLSSTDWSLSEFNPDTFCGITEESMKKKIDALKVYQNVVRERPHPRSEDNVMALACLRGSQGGHIFAEAFKTCWRRVL